MILEIENENLVITIENINTGVVLFADDIILLFGDVNKLRRSLEICDNFGIGWDIKYNPSKIKYIQYKLSSDYVLWSRKYSSE